MYIGVAIPLVIGLIVFVVRQLIREGRLIRERLGDYVRLGWLPESDPEALSRLRTRTRALWHAVFLGPDAFLATIRMQRAVTELAYLRDAMTRGLIDDAGLARERDVLAKIRAGTRQGHRAAGGPGGVPVVPPTPSVDLRLCAALVPRSCRPRRQLSGTDPGHRGGRTPSGKLLPSTQKSIPAGNRPTSRRWMSG